MLPRGARRVKLPRNMTSEVEVVFKERAIGIKVQQSSSAVVVIKSFHELSPGVESPASLSCSVGDALLSINGESVEFLTYKTLLQKIRASGRPLILLFAKWENESESETHPGDPSNSFPSSTSIDIENPDPVQLALQIAARKRTKVYTGKNFGGAHVALRQQERRCAAFVFLLLVCFMLFLYNRTEGNGSSNRVASNVITGTGRRFGNITKVDGKYVTIALHGDGNDHSGNLKRLKHHFHPLGPEEGGGD